MGTELTIGERIALLRRARGWTQMDLAINLGTDKTFVSRIETNTVKTIKSDMLAKIAQVLRVSADFILGITDDPPFEDKDLTALYEAEKAELETEHETQKKAKKRG